MQYSHLWRWEWSLDKSLEPYVRGLCAYYILVHLQTLEPSFYPHNFLLQYAKLLQMARMATQQNVENNQTSLSVYVLLMTCD
jgi:hypothetical protein